MDSDLSHMDPGGGAFLEVYFMAADDPVFMQCEELLNRMCRRGRAVSFWPRLLRDRPGGW